jgi:transposase
MRPRATAIQLERRRRQAIHLWRRGQALAEIARTVRAGRGSVWRWVQTYQEYGMPGLRARPIPGRPSYLSAEQKTHLAQVLLRGAHAVGYQTELWTLERIAKVIWKEFRVRYHPNALWHLLRGGAGVVRSPSGVRVSATRPRLHIGNATAGRI